MELSAALRGMDKGHGRRWSDSNGKQKRTVVLQHAVIQLIEKYRRSSWPEKQGAAQHAVVGRSIRWHILLLVIPSGPTPQRQRFPRSSAGVAVPSPLTHDLR